MSQILSQFDTGKLYWMLAVTLICWLVMVLAVLLDAWDGVQTSRRLGVKVSSCGMRQTVVKIGEYWRLLLFGLLIDLVGHFLSWYTLPFATMVFTVGVLVVEYISLREHAEKRRGDSQKVLDIAEKIVACGNADEAVKIVKSIRQVK